MRVTRRCWTLESIFIFEPMPAAVARRLLTSSRRQLSALNKGTRVVTLTVGGNDLSVAGIAAACAPGPSPACQTAINTALSLLATPPGVLAGRLASVYDA